MRILIILMLSGTLGILGCVDETDSDGTGGSSGTGGSAGTGGAGGEAGMGGEGGGGGSPAATFCDDFEALCPYGGENYADRDDCLASFDGFAMSRQDCVNTHIGLAGMYDEGTDDRELHCGHAAGASPCGA